MHPPCPHPQLPPPPVAAPPALADWLGSSPRPADWLAGRPRPAGAPRLVGRMAGAPRLARCLARIQPPARIENMPRCGEEVPHHNHPPAPHDQPPQRQAPVGSHCHSEMLPPPPRYPFTITRYSFPQPVTDTHSVFQAQLQVHTLAWATAPPRVSLKADERINRPARSMLIGPGENEAISSSVNRQPVQRRKINVVLYKRGHRVAVSHDHRSF